MRAGLTYLSTEQRVTFEWFQVGLGFGYLVAGDESSATTGVGGLTRSPPFQTLIITGVLGAHTLRSRSFASRLRRSLRMTTTTA